MTTSHVVVLSIPGLRLGDVQKTVTPTLYEWANRGAMAELTPTFPCVTSPVQASMLTGSPPGEHGVIANGFFDRDRREVAFWVAPNAVIEGEQVFSTVRAKSAEFTSAAWHLQNIKGADADYIVTPAPIHEADGTTKLWCYSKPEGLYQELLDEMGHFPLQHYWGPRAGIESTRWILQGAARLSRKHNPNLHWIYVPHLDYAAQKHGPNSAQSKEALVELDKELAVFAADLAGVVPDSDTVFLAVGEYALTDVARVVFPNRLLRQAGLLAVQERRGAELPDLTRSRAFAMVDHQFAHVFVQAGDVEAVDQCCDLFSDTSGIAGVFAGDQRSTVGLNHSRSGEIVLIAEDACWFAYYWWLDDAAAPGFARTVDIHRKPGYDPCEMFFDPATGGIPLRPEWVKGSHGVPATAPRHRTAVICSTSSAAVQTGQEYRDIAIKGITLELLGLSV